MSHLEVSPFITKLKGWEFTCAVSFGVAGILCGVQWGTWVCCFGAVRRFRGAWTHVLLLSDSIVRPPLGSGGAEGEDGPVLIKGWTDVAELLVQDEEMGAKEWSAPLFMEGGATGHG